MTSILGAGYFAGIFYESTPELLLSILSYRSTYLCMRGKLRRAQKLTEPVHLRTGSVSKIRGEECTNCDRELTELAHIRSERFTQMNKISASFLMWLHDAEKHTPETIMKY